MQLTKKWKQLIYALTIAILTLLAMFLITQLAFGGREIKLSSNAARRAVSPRVAKADPWMAAVWIEDNGSGESKGKAMLQAARYDGQTYSWATAPITIADINNTCVTHAAVAITDTIAHIVFDRALCQGGGNSALYYRRYDLEEQELSDQTLIINVGNQSVVDIDLVLDDDGLAHVIYNPASGEILYKKQENGGTWDTDTAATILSITSTEVITDYPAYHPRMAWGNNRLHVVWDAQIEPGNGIPIYRYCDADGPCGGPYHLEDDPYKREGMNTDAKTVVAAQGDRVMAAWQYCSNRTSEGCERFQILYKYSDSNGDARSFITPTKAIRGIYPYHHESGPNSGYPSSDAQEVGNYASQLNPDLILDADQNPIFAWHQSNSADPTLMMITTTIGTTPTAEDGFTNWQHPYGWAIGTEDRWDTRVQPEILLPSSPLTRSLHLFYMKKPDNLDYRINYLFLEEGVVPSTEDPPTEEPTEEPTTSPGDERVYLPLVNKNFVSTGEGE